MYKAVCLDLDGTLLDDNKKISEENKEAIKEIFDWACNNKNSINDATYNFQKIFSLKLTNFEMLNVKLI